MAAAGETDAGQAAKRSKETEEEGKTPPPPPVGAVRKQRQPTPDHPPYCWMIGEAIDELCEDGGSGEDSISAFIRAGHPGVPPAHNRLLRHYLKKHVVEGFFVCTAAGRYLRSPDDNTDVESPVEQAATGLSEEACVGSLVAEARKDGAGSAIPKRRGQRRAAAGLAAQEYVPASPVAVADEKDGSQAASSLPKRRGRSHAVVGLAAAEDSVPASPVAVADKDGSQAVSSLPKRRGRRRSSARLAAAEDSLPTSPAVVADKDGDQTASSTPKRRGWPRRLGMATATNSSSKALVPGQKDSSEVPYTSDKELALVIMGNGSATTSIMDKACTEATPTMPVDGGQPLELALVTTADVPVPVATPAIDDKDGCDAPSFNLALVAKIDDSCRASTSPESSSQACEPVLVAADDGSVPVLLVADKDGVEEAPYATNKSVRQPRKAVSVPTAGKKDGGKAPSATPKGHAPSATPKGHRRQCTAVATDRSALTPVAGKKAGRKVSFASPKLTPVAAGACSTQASVADQDGIQARKLYPVTADEIPDDPACCLLALPCLTPAAANA